MGGVYGDSTAASRGGVRRAPNRFGNPPGAESSPVQPAFDRPPWAACPTPRVDRGLDTCTGRGAGIGLPRQSGILGERPPVDVLPTCWLDVHRKWAYAHQVRRKDSCAHRMADQRLSVRARLRLLRPRGSRGLTLATCI